LSASVTGGGSASGRLRDAAELFLGALHAARLRLVGRAGRDRRGGGRGERALGGERLQLLLALVARCVHGIGVRLRSVGARLAIIGWMPASPSTWGPTSVLAQAARLTGGSPAGAASGRVARGRRA
jgi:hypothetical protein